MLYDCVDMSAWGGPLTDAEAQAMGDEGITTIIVATGPGGYGTMAGQQAAQAVDFGFALEVYHYLEFQVAITPANWIRAGYNALGENYANRVQRAWMNIEHPVQFGVLEQRIALMDAHYYAADSFYPKVGHCTARWYHVQPQYMNNTDHWASRQLWNAYYDELPDVSGLPYGGWTESSVAIEQFGGTRLVAGQSVDINKVYLKANGGTNLEELAEELAVGLFRVRGEETMTWAEQVAAARYRLTHYIADNPATLVDRLESHLTIHPGGGATQKHSHLATVGESVI